MLLIDLIVLGIIALSAFIGYKQGLIKSAIKILSFFIAIAVALVLYKPVANIVIEKTTIDDKISNTIVENISLEEQNKDEESNVKNIIPDAIVKTTNGTINEMAQTLSTKIVEICVVLILYILVRIALRFISALADLVAKLPIIKQFNKLGGLIYGFVKGIFMVYVLLAILYLLSPLINKDTINKIDGTTLTKFMYNNNLITNIIL